MSKLKYGLLLLCAGAASTQLAQAQSERQISRSVLQQGAPAAPTQSPTPLPTVILPAQTSVPVPTVAVPKSKPKPKPRPKHANRHATHTPPSRYTWIWAFLTSYCPGTAGWISSSGTGVYYGMLANDYYPFGTHVYMPVLAMTGVVEDRFGGWVGWNYFDVWSPICYATPTGWFKVGIVR